MNESVSLLDLGMLRLQLHLDSLANINPAWSYFDWDKNQVIIWSSSFESSWTPERVDEACRIWFDAIRSAAGVDIEKGSLYPVFSASRFAEYFSHEGYDNTIGGKKTSEMVAQIDKKFWLAFSWFGSGNVSGEIKSIQCSGPLLEKGYSTKVEKVE